MAITNYNQATGQYYTVNPIIPTGWATQNYLFSNPKLWQSYQDTGLVNVIGAGPKSSSTDSSGKLSAYTSTDYTPNQYTANQLAGYGAGGVGGGNTIPHWMQQAFANKMANYGAPANGPLPYKLTDSSFRGMAPSTNQNAPVAQGKASKPVGV